MTDSAQEYKEKRFYPGNPGSSDQLAWLRSKSEADHRAIVARCAENVKKVALIRAISDNPADPVITAEHAEWATTLVKHCIRTLLREAENNIADGENDANIKAVLNVVRKAGEKGIPATTDYIGNNVRTVKGDDRRKLLRDMVELKLLDAVQTVGEGKAPMTTIYSIMGGPTVH